MRLAAATPAMPATPSLLRPWRPRRTMAVRPGNVVRERRSRIKPLACPLPPAPSKRRAPSERRHASSLLDDAELQAAIAASQQQDTQQASAPSSSQPPANPDPAGMSEDDQLQLALQLSMAGADGSSAQAMDTAADSGSAAAAAQASSSTEAGAQAASGDDAITDQEFFGNILSSLPGVDPNDAQIQELLRNYNPTAGSADGDKDKKDKKEEKK
ncbi:MAG: hypothetical protein CML43_06975 [Rhodobacteraceae bacterium]|nr:hypothetical protein [Paracoccaceae bacterium]